MTTRRFNPKTVPGGFVRREFKLLESHGTTGHPHCALADASAARANDTRPLFSPNDYEHAT
jgi:hypothetical protein